jgi:hypothetical protein
VELQKSLSVQKTPEQKHIAPAFLFFRHFTLRSPTKQRVACEPKMAHLQNPVFRISLIQF